MKALAKAAWSWRRVWALLALTVVFIWRSASMDESGWFVSGVMISLVALVLMRDEIKAANKESEPDDD